jgi:hypothetical protein
MLAFDHPSTSLPKAQPAARPSQALVQVPSVAEVALSTLQPAGVLGSELPTPLTNGLVRDRDSALSQGDPRRCGSSAEPEVEPDGMANDLGREPVAAVAGGAVVHLPTLPAMG